MRQRIGLAIFVAVCMILLVACGGGNGSNGVVTKPTVTPSPTQTPQQVTVTITNNAIHSSITTFSSNTPYNFTVTNSGTAAHDFIITNTVNGSQPTPQPTQVKQPTQTKPLYVVPSSQLAPGKTVSFTYRFPPSIGQAYIVFTEHLSGPSGSQGPTLPVQVNKAS